MKTLLTILLTALTLQSYALSIAPPLHGELENSDRWVVDQAFGHIYYGAIEIDEYYRSASLNYQFQAPCPEGMNCIQALQNKFVNLPMISINQGGCGSIEYIAQKDEMPSDGIKETLTIVSHHQNVCMHLPVDAATEITYEVSYYSWLTGEIVSFKAELLAEMLHY